jgi:hypothetical protein
MLSKNGLAIAIFITSYFGLEFTETEIIAFVAAISQVVSFLLLVWNQLDRSDTKWFFWKK